jgi:hypothetical protein
MENIILIIAFAVVGFFAFGPALTEDVKDECQRLNDEA